MPGSIFVWLMDPGIRLLLPGLKEGNQSANERE
jgi:hypothetical protein